MNTEYANFLRTKFKRPIYSGFEIDPALLNENLYPFQRAIVQWSLLLGKSAIFANVGLGKTLCQLSWANQVVKHTGKPVLILAPLAVSHQTIREGEKFGIGVVYRRDEIEIEDSDRIIITNYERLEKFDNFVMSIDGIVLDESGILKSFMGKRKQLIIDTFEHTPYKLACSATPAPNDHVELGNHSQFLGIMKRSEMLATWFVNDANRTGTYRLKKHAEDDFWRWLTSYAVCISKPQDLGDDYDMSEFELPELNIIPHYVKTNEESIQEAWAEGRLFPDTAVSSTTLGRAKRKSLEQRVGICVDIVASIPEDESILIWCYLNDEADALRKAIPEATEVRGSDKSELKTQKLLDFSDKKSRILITKAKIAGHGMNWQHCNRVIFFGLDFSFESFYQAKGRTHRYGQLRDVDCHLIYSELEGNVETTLQTKQDAFATMQIKMNEAMREHGLFRDGARLNHLSADGSVAIEIPNWLVSKEYEGVTT